ncbi:pH regulation protein F [Iodidimonas gelatinilytica]|uniref:pH regulation protein F n=1 Tax=Iodidimonas gelatinilytica TaxID=1236966 RepID=A0A5A7MY98_9PROT|nr:monovalent cation/H+ antiporter complex subunit F [Iodidimonas gelatinilytica]GER00314.1 pH regulation protein F [Iodidimonas gelatinilytica]
MFLGASLAILVTMCLAILRAVLGPSVYDRILAANMFGTKTVLFLAVLSFLSGRPDFLDLALAYALINFVSVIAVLQFVERRARNRSKENQASDAVKEGAQ